MKGKVAIHSVPRSGSTWLGEIFNSHGDVKYCFQPLFSYKLKGFLTENSSCDDIDDFYNLLSETEDDFINQKIERKSKNLPIFKKSLIPSHIVYKEVRYHYILDNMLRKHRDLKLILLVRDPVMVMNSWINAPKEFDSTWSVSEQILSAAAKNMEAKENFYGLNAWIKTTKKFEYLAKKHPSKVYLLNYEHLKKDPMAKTKEIFNFCNLDLQDSTINFIKQSQVENVEDPYSVFRANGGTALSLSNEIISLIYENVEASKLDHYINTKYL